MNKYVEELVYVNYYPHLCYMMVLGVIPQTTTLKGEKQVDSNLPYTFVRLGGYEQVPLEHPTLC